VFTSALATRLAEKNEPQFSMGWVDPSVGLGQSADGLGWIGSHKMDP